MEAATRGGQARWLTHKDYAAGSELKRLGKMSGQSLWSYTVRLYRNDPN